MRHHWLFKAGIVASAVILALVGLRFLVAPLIIGHPDSVHIVVTEEVRNPDLHTTLVFDRQFSQQATAVYSELVAGGPIQDRGVWYCPFASADGPWYHYELTFYRWGMTTATATDDAQGCMFFGVQYPFGATEGYSWYRGDSPSFWVRLYELTGAPQPIGG